MASSPVLFNTLVGVFGNVHGGSFTEPQVQQRSRRFFSGDSANHHLRQLGAEVMDLSPVCVAPYVSDIRRRRAVRLGR